MSNVYEILKQIHTTKTNRNIIFFIMIPYDRVEYSQICMQIIASNNWLKYYQKE